jgi:hypothetical protein
MTNTTVTNDKLKSIAQLNEEVRNTLIKGMKTNYGIFSHFDNDNFAFFNDGRTWVGATQLMFIQLR